MIASIFLGFLGLGGSEILIILGIVLLMFGGKKIPELMRGLGKGVKEFKDASNNPLSTEPAAPVVVDEERKNIQPQNPSAL